MPNNLYNQLTGFNSMQNKLSQIMSMLRGNPNALMQNITNNPQYQQFLANNRGKSPEQIAKENGIDINMIYSMFKR